MNYIQVFEWCGLIAGLFYIYYQFHVSVKLWVANLVMSLFYVAINFHAHLYALTGLYVYYCLAAIYGLAMWKRQSKSTARELPISHMQRILHFKIWGVIAVLTLLISFIFTTLGEGDVVVVDAFTSSVSIVSLWLLSRKYVEQWLYWIVVDVVNTILYIYKGLYPTAALFAFYTIVAIYGYYHWIQLMKNTEK